MNSDYAPKFPRAVNGGDWRAPLDHPEVEAIGKRADRLYRTVSLADEDRAMLIKIYAELASTDSWLSRTIGERVLPETTVRPRSSSRPGWDDRAVPDIEWRVGFVARAGAYVERLEQRHAEALDVVLRPAHAVERVKPVLVDDTPDMGPGDDI